MPKTPEDCETMADVRVGVDATDRELVALLERRFGLRDFVRVLAVLLDPT